MFCVTEAALKIQWQAVQDKYQRERKLAKKSNGVSLWPLLESLDFLKQSSRSQSKQHRADDAAATTDNAATTSSSTSATATTMAAACSSSSTLNNHHTSNTPNHHQQQHHHHAVVIVSAPSADNQHTELVATYSTNVSVDDTGAATSSAASGSRKRRRDSATTGDDGDDMDGAGNAMSGGALERKIERIVKRIVTRDGSSSGGSTAVGSSALQTYEEEFFSKFICEKLKSFPKKLRADAKSHIFQYLHELDNTLQ